MSPDEHKGIDVWQEAQDILFDLDGRLWDGSYVNVRPSELEQLKEFLTAKIANREGGFIHLGGKPGTGKTLTVREAIRELTVQTEYISCVGPSAELDNLSSSIAGEPLYDGSSTRVQRVIVLDEIDQLCHGGAARQQLLDSIIDIAMSPKSTLLVVGISNTLDNRFGNNHIVFSPYTADELSRIVLDRVGEGAFHPNALNYITTTVARSGGDARAALSLCSKAINETLGDLFLAQGETPGDTEKAHDFKQVSFVTALHVINAEAMAYIRRVSGLPPRHKTLLAVCIYLRTHYHGTFRLKDLSSEYVKALPQLHKCQGSALTGFNDMVGNLEDYGVIKVEPRHGRVDVLVDREDFIRALTEGEKIYLTKFIRAGPSE